MSGSHYMKTKCEQWIIKISKRQNVSTKIVHLNRTCWNIFRKTQIGLSRCNDLSSLVSSSISTIRSILPRLSNSFCDSFAMYFAKIDGVILKKALNTLFSSKKKILKVFCHTSYPFWMISPGTLIVWSNLILDCWKSTVGRQSNNNIASFPLEMRLCNWGHKMNVEFCSSTCSRTMFSLEASSISCWRLDSFFFSSYL